MIEQNKIRQTFYKKKEILDELGENPSADDVLNHLLGDYDSCGNGSSYTLFKYEYSKKTLFNRINLLWVYPLFFISIPFQWMIRGDFGVSRDSKIGKIVNKLVQFD